ncbi:hypothetical protein BYT27DRAFT_7256900 [Phlegmacium glaucopus]|nr:hypothetical protein BYT27DRAFT_7256900 [Phlegmacium glaucopus]
MFPQLLAIASTVFRLVHRKRNQGLWWDDGLALTSLALALIFFATTWLNLIVKPTLHVVTGWLFTLSFPTLIWTTRISLALSIARILPRQYPTFTLVLYLVFFFGAICLALFIVLTVACGLDTSWPHHPPYLYLPTRPIAVFILCGDLVGDTLLITVPLRLFWNAKLQPTELLLVKIGFAASVFTSICSITCAAFLLAPIGSGLSSVIVSTGLTYLLACISLMACNALVVITFLYRYFRRQAGQLDAKTSTTQNTQEPYTFTNPSDDITSSNLPRSFALTSTFETVGGRHTFSFD